MKFQSIAIIICYFGKWPRYFLYFLHSCKYNPTVGFIIITDNAEQILNRPHNVKIIKNDLSDLRMTFSTILGLRVAIDDLYKVCVFKPAYGFLFPEFVKGYDFWGHGDIDIIYGNIRNFVTEEMLSEYEVITARHDFLSGTFTLFKNSIEMNELFR